jgi:type 2 lantibiotic biosynthesis protein LanM
MIHVVAQSSPWYQALTLNERLTSLLKLPRPFSGTIDDAAAGRRLKRWRSQAPFTNEALFTRRLEMDGITEEGLTYLLGEPAEALGGRWPTPPDWLWQLSQAFDDRGGNNDGRFLETVIAGTENASDQNKLLYLIEPLLANAVDRLRVGIQVLAQERRPARFDSQAVVRTLVDGILKSAFQMSVRTLILELNVARVQGRLHGETPEARFHSFVESLRDRKMARALLEEYPVLARQLVALTDRWLNCSLEFLQRLCGDWTAIQAEFGPGQDLGILTGVNLGVGDAHRGGRAVAIAVFDSGFTIVYKPKSLAIDIHFQEMLKWLDDRGAHPPFRRLKALDRGKYGWVEFVASESCKTRDEVERFYQRQGAYLALLYAIQATDFHLENLIAAGEHPVLIDLESLFHPDPNSSLDAKSEWLASESLNRSVLRIGLLPQRLWIEGDGEGIDVSGLGGAPGQLTPFAVPYCDGAGTDEMKISRMRFTLSAGRNRPLLNGAGVNPLDFSEDIIAGFTQVYHTLQRYRHELLAKDGPLSSFAHDEARVILRPSKTYAHLLRESFHPDLLRHGLDRERYFDRLWMTVEQWPELAQVIGAERDDLQCGDIPMFTTRVDSRDLWTSSGKRIPEWFKESGMALARQLISKLDAEDMNRQVWFIRASLTSLSIDSLRSPWPQYRLTEPQRPADRASLLEMARQIGDRLDQLALRSETDSTWIGLSSAHERYWSLTPLGIDLYSGAPGVCLFLATLGEVTGEERYIALARSAFGAMARQIGRLRSSFTTIGGFSGWGGVIYVLTRLGALWREREYLEQAAELVDLVSTLIERDEDYDIIAGSAGCIGALISHYLHTGSARSLAVATQCGEHLLAHGKVMDPGLGWCGRGSNVPLAGFSHGTAGISWALSRLAALTGDERYRDVALAAVEYERSLFSPSTRTWADLRRRPLNASSEQVDQSHTITAWCHGAPGVGLGRLQLLTHSDQEETRAEIQTALEITLARGFGYNHCLCHGDLGNLDFLLQAQAALGDPALEKQIDRLSAIVLESLRNQGPLCGVPDGIETPGLMNGLAGIGYGLLRLAEPTLIPSALSLEP